MAYVIGASIGLFLLLLVLAAATGRVDLRSCCTVADPRRDARMRAAFEDDDPPTPTHPTGRRPAGGGR